MWEEIWNRNVFFKIGAKKGADLEVSAVFNFKNNFDVIVKSMKNAKKT